MSEDLVEGVETCECENHFVASAHAELASSLGTAESVDHASILADVYATKLDGERERIG